jgi:lysozyme
VTELTPRIVGNLLCEEGIVLQAYRDSQNIWTAFGGIATTGGFNVLQYKDKPQSLRFALQVTVDALRTRYFPEVLKAFHGAPLTEAQAAAALSFQWNTEAAATATWVADFLAGKPQAESDMMHWSHPPSIIPRRTREKNLFFHGTWRTDWRAPVYADVAKPSYHPIHAQSVEILTVLQSILGGQ